MPTHRTCYGRAKAESKEVRPTQRQAEQPSIGSPPSDEAEQGSGEHAQPVQAVQALGQMVQSPFATCQAAEPALPKVPVQEDHQEEEEPALPVSPVQEESAVLQLGNIDKTSTGADPPPVWILSHPVETALTCDEHMDAKPGQAPLHASGFSP